MTISWTFGDAPALAEAAASARTLAAEIDHARTTMRAVGSWTAEGWWTGQAAETTWENWSALLAWTDELHAACVAFADACAEAAHKIQAAFDRAKRSLISGVVEFTVAAALTIVIVAGTEGAAIAPLVAGRSFTAIRTADGLWKAVVVVVRLGFSSAWKATTLRSVSAIGFQTGIPAAATAVGNGVQHKPWTVDDISGILIASGVGLIVGEAVMGYNIAARPGILAQIASGAGSQAVVGAGGTALSQVLIEGEVIGRVVGINAALGAGIGAIGAAGGAVILKKFPNPVATGSVGAQVQLTAQPTGRAGASTGSALPPITQNVIVQATRDPATGASSVVAQLPGGAPMLTAPQVAPLPRAQVNSLIAGQRRIATASGYTELADTAAQFRTEVHSDWVRTQRLVLTDPALATAHARADIVGVRVQAQLGELRSLETEVGTKVATTAGDSTFDADGYILQAQGRQRAILDQLAQTSVEYENSLQVLRNAHPADTHNPFDQAHNGADRLRSWVERQVAPGPNIAQVVAAPTTPPAAADGGANPAPLGPQSPHLVGVPVSQVPQATGMSTQAAAALPAPEALGRVVASSSWGIVLGGTSGVVTGAAVVPHLPKDKNASPFDRLGADLPVGAPPAPPADLVTDTSSGTHPQPHRRLTEIPAPLDLSTPEGPWQPGTQFAAPPTDGPMGRSVVTYYGPPAGDPTPPGAVYQPVGQPDAPPGLAQVHQPAFVDYTGDGPPPGYLPVGIPAGYTPLP